MTMKNLLLLFALSFCFVSVTFAQSRATRNLSDFDRVSVQEGIYVKMNKGNTHKAEIRASGIDIEDVLTEVKGDKLKIHLEGNNHRNVKVEIMLTFQDLEGIEASSGAKVELESSVSSNGFYISGSSGGRIAIEERLTTKDLEIDCSSAANITVESMEAIDVEMGSSSGGQIVIEGGRAKTVEADVSSGARINAPDLECQSVMADASSGGGIKIHAANAIQGNASSGGWVYYNGSPDKQMIRESSGGRIKAL
mgnify:CR=1 FL=1